MTAEPFAFDCSKPTTLTGSDLEKLIARSGGRMKKAEKAKKAESKE